MSETGTLRLLLPYLVATAAVAVVATLALTRLAPVAPVAAPAVVTFDVVRFGNAQRAVAAVFLGQKKEQAEVGSLLLDVSRRTMDAIERAAGANTLVLVKQGVVGGQLRDITDDVLRELGLPTDVPAPSPMGYLLDQAPTYLSLGPLGRVKEKEIPPPATKVLP